MKTSSLKYLLLAASLISLFSCNKENEISEIQPEQELFTYTFGIGSAETSDAITKATLGSDEQGLYLAWESTDKLNTWAYSTVTNNYSYNNESSINTGDNPVTFQIASYRALNVKDKVYCKFPYTTGAGTSPESVSMTIPSTQKQVGATYNASNMPMVSLPFEIPVAVESQSNAKVGDVLFYNLGALVEFDIFSPTGLYKDEKIESVQFTTSTASAGNFTIDLTKIDADDPSTLDISDYSVKSITTNIQETELTVGNATNNNNATKVYMVVAPESETGYTGTVVVNTDQAQYTYTVSSAIKLQRAGVKRLGLNLEKAGVRKASSLPDGDYVILAYYSASGYKAMSNAVASSSRLGQKAFTLWDGESESVVLEDKDIVWTLAKSGDTYTLTSKGNGEKLTYSSSGSASTADTGKSLTITEGTGTNEGMYTVTNSNFTLRHNSSSSFFAFYSTSTTMTNYFYFVKALVKTKLASPQNVIADVENGNEIVVVWDKVTDAETYKVTLNGTTETTDELSYRFTGVPDGTYVVSVVASSSSDAFADSEAGTSDPVKVGTPSLAKPTIDSFVQKATGFSASWTAGDEYTTSYSWDIFVDAVEDDNLIGTGTTTAKSIDIAFESDDFPETSFIEGKTYYLVVTAKAAGYTSTDSDSESFVATGSVTTYKWVKVTSASDIVAGEQYILAGVHTSSSTYAYMPNTASSNANPTLTSSTLLSASEIADSDVTDNMIWDIVDAGSSKFYIQSHANSSDKLNTTKSTGQTIRISSGNTTNNKWTIAANNSHGWDISNVSFTIFCTINSPASLPAAS